MQCIANSSGQALAAAVRCCVWVALKIDCLVAGLAFLALALWAMMGQL